jgi:hypothetical protein
MRRSCPKHTCVCNQQVPCSAVSTGSNAEGHTIMCTLCGLVAWCSGAHGCRVASHDGEGVSVAWYQPTPVQQHVERLQHVGCMRGVVVGVGSVVARFDSLEEPGCEKSLHQHGSHVEMLWLLPSWRGRPARWDAGRRPMVSMHGNCSVTIQAADAATLQQRGVQVEASRWRAMLLSKITPRVTWDVPGQCSNIQLELGDEVTLMEQAEGQHRQGAAPGDVC